jgi:tRNA G10  N-methylase Trm11
MTQSERQTLNDLNGKEWVKSTKSWFIINPRSRSKKQLQHPAKYPEELVQRLVRFFTNIGDWVLDPFAGVGSTLIASKELQRRSIGIELNPDYVETARRYLEKMGTDVQSEIILGDARYASNLLEQFFDAGIPAFDYLITSPPYWDMLRKSRGGNDSVHKERGEKGLPQFYSNSSLDLGNIEEYNEYLEKLKAILTSLKNLLRPQAYLTIVVQNIRDPDGVMRPLAWDLAAELSGTYALRQEMIWCQDNKRLGCWGYPTTYVSNVHHHYCLIFQNR